MLHISCCTFVLLLSLGIRIRKEQRDVSHKDGQTQTTNPPKTNEKILSNCQFRKRKESNA